MPIRNHPDLLESASRGYQGLPYEGLAAAPTDYAWQAGAALAKTGRTAPERCASGRGSSIRVETAGGTEFLARFSRKTGALEALDRIH